jgi:hypothetical protein
VVLFLSVCGLCRPGEKTMPGAAPRFEPISVRRLFSFAKCSRLQFAKREMHGEAWMTHG